ncbi:MAG: TetR/AcrR family transcriptional regulator [Alphaproteobacteria bacterium]
MVRLDEQTQAARREHILNSAEQCFTRQGFHQTSVQDICREAGISAGAFYVYFPSKEALITGLCEREKHQLSDQLAFLGEAPDFMQALATMADTYCLQQSHEKLRLQVEINAEALRNPAVCSTVNSIDKFVLDGFEQLVRKARDEGRIKPADDPAIIARIISLIGDGIFWQRALNKDFNAAEILPTILSMVSCLINPAGTASSDTYDTRAVNSEGDHESTESKS